MATLIKIKKFDQLQVKKTDKCLPIKIQDRDREIINRQNPAIVIQREIIQC